MEILTTLLLIAVIYFIVTAKSDLLKKIGELEQNISHLHLLLKKGQEERPAAPAKELKPDTPRGQVQEQPGPIPIPEAPRPEVLKPERQIGPDNLGRTQPPPLPQYRNYFPPKVREPQKSFFERYPDLEKFIGENLINKIGIAILVLAIGYFVKYAIDNNWIGPVGRVGIGILCGSILIGFAHKLRKNYTAFSSVLAGGGLAVYYFTITLAFHQFHLFSQTVSFIILAGITLFAVALALLYDKQELAVIALVGGMASPFMVSNGHNNFNAFFIYLLILNAGLLIIAYNKAWRILNISAFSLTSLVYITVLNNMPQAAYHLGFIYGTVFYLLFFTINIAHNVREGKAFIASDYSILLINTALYFSTGLGLLSAMDCKEYDGAFCATLAAINLALSYILFKNKKVDINILYLLIGITLTFVSLTAPIQLHGNNITLFWASETVLLYWLYQRSGIKLMKATSLLVWLLMLISLGMDWLQVYGNYNTTLTILANRGFITTLCAAISTYILYILTQKDAPEKQTGWGIPPELLRSIALLFLFLSGALEINHQFLTHYPNTSLNVVYLMLYTPAFMWVFNLVSQTYSKAALNPYVSLALLAAVIVVYLIFIPDSFSAQRLMLEKHNPPGLHFLAHWAGAIFTGMLFYESISLLRDKIDLPDWAGWVLCAGIVTFLSFEVSLVGNQLFYSATYPYERVETVYIKTGLPVLWGLSSFAIMWLGMRYKQRTLRIISLSLFTLTLVKLFIFDIRNIPAAGKIIAFFCLGILLLIVSFMYQKVKQIIAADENPAQDTP